MNDKRDNGSESITPLGLFDALHFHESIVESSRSLYASRHYAQAIFEAYKRIEIEVRRVSGLSDKSGKDRMAQAFGGQKPKIRLNPMDTWTDRNEQEGFKFIFMGIVLGIRNPKAHDPIEQNDPYKTLEYLGLASLLLKRIDERLDHLPTGEKASLVALYDATDGLNWNNNRNWLSDKPVGEWHGITTDSLGSVTKIVLNANWLSGEVPPELGNLTSLRRLSLGYNLLSGEIPAELGRLTNLEGLILDCNQLSGKIPSELCKLTNLEWLSLSGNQLSGCVPDRLRYVQHNDFRVLGLPFCDLYDQSTPLPIREKAALVALYDATDGPNWKNNRNWLSDKPVAEWHGVTTDSSGSVTEIELNTNRLSGDIPPELGKLTNLKELILYNNELSGEIPPELGKLANLMELALDDNLLSGEIPPELGKLTKLKGLVLDGNLLSGEIPSELCNLTNLEGLALYGNKLSGCIPEGLRYIAPDNDLAGLGLPFCDPYDQSIPLLIRERAGLVTLYYVTNGPNWKNNRNWLSDKPVGEWHGVTTDSSGSITKIELHSSQLSGEIPAGLGSLTNLKALHLSGNKLSWEIPSELSKLTDLESLNLGGNRLSGEIPSELAKLTNLESLNLGGNRLSGRIPSELTKLTNLESLNLGGNRLSGKIPSELGRLTNLKRLILYNNELSRAIPPELGNLANLVELALDGNRLNGDIPPELGNLTNLISLDLSGNRLSWAIPPELGDLANLMELALDGNWLNGDIPPELGNLTNLISLDLSGNRLSGEIPSELGTLTNLINLGLSGNKLSGRIPAGLLYVRNNDLAELGLPFQVG